MRQLATNTKHFSQFRFSPGSSLRRAMAVGILEEYDGSMVRVFSVSPVEHSSHFAVAFERVRPVTF